MQNRRCGDCLLLPGSWHIPRGAAWPEAMLPCHEELSEKSVKQPFARHRYCAGTHIARLRSRASLEQLFETNFTFSVFSQAKLHLGIEIAPVLKPALAFLIYCFCRCLYAQSLCTLTKSNRL